MDPEWTAKLLLVGSIIWATLIIILVIAAD